MRNICRKYNKYEFFERKYTKYEVWNSMIFSFIQILDAIKEKKIIGNIPNTAIIKYIYMKYYMKYSLVWYGSYEIFQKHMNSWKIILKSTFSLKKISKYS